MATPHVKLPRTVLLGLVRGASQKIVETNRPHSPHYWWHDRELCWLLLRNIQPRNMHAISMHRAYSGYYTYLQVELQCNNLHFEKIIRCGVTRASVEAADCHITKRLSCLTDYKI